MCVCVGGGGGGGRLQSSSHITLTGTFVCRSQCPVCVFLRMLALFSYKMWYGMSHDLEVEGPQRERERWIPLFAF